MKASKPFCLFFLLHIFFLVILSYGSSAAAASGKSTTSIGVVIDEDSRVGKEQKIAMKIAVQNLNNSTNHKLTIHFQNVSAGNPFQAAIAADQLIKVEKVQVLIGSQAWQEAAIVADVGNRAQVPVISLAASSVSPKLTHVRWPFLVQMASNSSKEMESVASIVHSYSWKKVVVIYEDGAYGDPGALVLLSKALIEKGSHVEYCLVLPSYTSLSDPQGFIGDEVVKLLSRKSRVFIFLQSSLLMAKHLVREARRIGLMERDSVWIVTDSITSVLDSSDPLFVTSMEGAIGTKSYYSKETSSFMELRAQFREIIKSDYPEEENLEPGVYALRAYDSIMAISHAVTKLGSDENTTAKTLLEGILSSKFLGLSGNISFRDGSLLDSSNLRIINVVGKVYKDLGFWSSEGFLKNVDQVKGGARSMKTLVSTVLVNWPGNLTRDPKGWIMPSDVKKMKIAVPGKTVYPKFVEVVNDSRSVNFSGFCIDLFGAIVNVLKKNYSLPYEFIPFNGTYDDLVLSVSNETYDAAVGDVTIIESRAKLVEFTQPFAESGLSMMVQYKHKPTRAWLFLKPFSPSMWLATIGILFYTMFIVWFFERASNPDFKGPCHDQLGTTMWFTFSSLFFAHKEKVYSNFTKMVVVVWLFVVLVLTSSYTASLSSMLTIDRVEPKVEDLQWLRNKNATVGCDGGSFVTDYLTNVLKLENIKHIENQYDYISEFDKGGINASFIELPYQRFFLEDNCNHFTTVGPTYRFGGFAFAFQKGSPIARDVSEAILTLTENGTLKQLETKWFPLATNCSARKNTGSLTIESFWGIYLISGATSTVCFLIFIAKLLVLRKTKDRNQRNEGASAIPAEEGNLRKAIAIVRYNRRDNRISLDIYLSWVEFWRTENFQKKSSIQKSNRRSGVDGRPSTHTSGSASHRTVAARAKVQYKREPTADLIFYLTHTKRVKKKKNPIVEAIENGMDDEDAEDDGNVEVVWIDKKSQKIYMSFNL
ncbi:Glutamate receptor [Heracleum sosnowskyi]|uniref:Glutamate receptor n=1 Tax=Heracleum sosnowskyi TaxID=360622 RepID=A0AAD8MML8_9APIA|nr:Glutamate receptor [Heracleum sosnowskyi]